MPPTKDSSPAKAPRTEKFSVGAAVAATLFFFGAQCVVGLFIGVQSIPVLLTGITLGWSATALLVRARALGHR